MNNDLADRLMEEINARLQFQFPCPYQTLLRDILDGAPTPEYPAIISKIPKRTIIVRDSSNPEYRLTFTRVIGKGHVVCNERMELGSLTENILHYFGRSSDVWVRRLLSDQRMVNLMHSSTKVPYMLLAEITGTDTSGTSFSKPLAVMAGVQQDAVRRWEEQNTVYWARGFYGLPKILIGGQYSRTPSGTSPAR